MPDVTRRQAIASIGLAIAGAPAVLRGRYPLFAQSTIEYSARAVRLMQESVVVDLLNQFRFEDYKDKPPKKTRTGRSR